MMERVNHECIDARESDFLAGNGGPCYLVEHTFRLFDAEGSSSRVDLRSFKLSGFASCVDP